MSTKKKENPALIETQHNGVTMILEKKSNGNKAPRPVWRLARWRS